MHGGSSFVEQLLFFFVSPLQNKNTWLHKDNGIPSWNINAFRSIFVPSAEYQLIGTLATVAWATGPRSLYPRFRIRLPAEINVSESVTKCAVTNADSGGHEQIKTEITAGVQTFLCCSPFCASITPKMAFYGNNKRKDWDRTEMTPAPAL